MLCVQNIDTCSAFSFVDTKCGLGSVGTAVYALDNVTGNSRVVSVWMDPNARKGQLLSSRTDFPYYLR